MKNIVIAAGYATRLYPITKNFPKPLLKIGNHSILGRMIKDIDNIADIEEHIIVTNHKFAPIFEEWKTNLKHNTENFIPQKPIKIINDGTITNETRLGAVKDLLLAINTCSINDDILVAAADNLLDFSFSGFIDYFKKMKSSVIMCHKEPDLKALQRTGVIKVDENMKVLLMQEKPEIPVSNWAVPPFYIYSKKDLALIKGCMEHGCKFDAPGNLAHYLCTKTNIHAWPMPGKRFDIGSIDSYNKALHIFKDI